VSAGPVIARRLLQIRNGAGGLAESAEWLAAEVEGAWAFAVAAREFAER
jgi:hypothetical protein